MWGATAAMGAGGEAAGLVIVGALSSVVLPASLERAPHSVRGKWGGLGKSRKRSRGIGWGSSFPLPTFIAFVAVVSC